MDFSGITSLISAALAATLAVIAYLREPPSVARTSFVALMMLMAMIGVTDGFSLMEAPIAETISLQRYSFLATSLLPGVWLGFSLSYSRGNARTFMVRWRLVLICAFVIPICLSLPGIWNARDLPTRVVKRDWFLSLGMAGLGLHAMLLLSAALAMMNLERTFRTATGTMRWRIKYLILGCAVLLGGQIYISSEVVLLGGLKATALEALTASRLVGCALIGFSLFRSRLAESDVYPSQTFLYQSFTAVFAGSYLLLVGVLAKAARLFGSERNLPLQAFVIVLGLVGLAVLLMSDRIRLRLQQTLSRHLRRPLHDYRTVWTHFAERTASMITREDLCREVARFVSETLNVLSVTIFLVEDQKQKLLFGASTSLSENRAKEMLQGLTVDFPADWKRGCEPLDLDASEEPWIVALKRLNPDHFDKGGSRICIPLVASQQFLGLLTLTDRVSGVPFSQEDFDLLKCVGGQTAASLLNLRLSASLLRAKELEAFQTMSTFFVHDLKNTALTLSLMLQNLPVHFANPEFREDSLRSIAKAVTRINDLIARLGALKGGLKIQPRDADLNKIVAQSLGSLGELPGAEVTQALEPLPTVRIDPEQIQTALTNLVLNAKDAVGDDGKIHIATTRNNGWAVLQVTDNGCGISREFLAQSLFRPFQTTKKKGIGIGMYQTRMIVEAHAGRIEVDSEVGKGTTFRILLPLASQN